MSKQPVMVPALSAEALMGKSKAYIARALAAKARGSMSEHQLWASLALELLGKAALAKVHPCLVADPQSSISLFAAAGMNVGTDIKTIVAKTVFERLTHISKRLDKKTQEFCTNMSLKRNAELHSGERREPQSRVGGELEAGVNELLARSSFEIMPSIEDIHDTCRVLRVAHPIELNAPRTGMPDGGGTQIPARCFRKHASVDQRVERDADRRGGEFGGIEVGHGDFLRTEALRR